MANLRKKCLLFLVWVTIFQSHHVGAKQSVKVVTELFDRFQYLDQNDELTGYSVSVVNELLKLAGDRAEIEIFPWSVAFKKAKEERNTLIFSMARTSERENDFIWIGRVFAEPVYFWTLKKLNIPPAATLEELKNYTIAIVRDANSHDYLIKHQFPNLYVMTSTFSNNDALTRMKMLNGNRAHIVIASESDVVNAIKHIGLGRDALAMVYQDKALNNDLYVAFNRNSDKDIVKRYQQAFDYLLNSGRLAKLQEVWELK